MQTTDTTDAPSDEPKNTSAKGMSRRDFVERLRRTAMYAVPVMAAVSMMTPKAMGSS